MGRRPLNTFYMPLIVPLMSAIKAGRVRDKSVMRGRAPPPPPAAAVCGVRELDVRPPAQVWQWSLAMLLRAQLYCTKSAGPTYV